MLYILWGPDDYSISAYLDDLKKQAETSSVFSGGITTLEGQQITAEQIGMNCSAAPFLGGKRMVVTRGLLGKFENDNKPGKLRKSVPERREQESKAFASSLQNIPDTTTVVLVEGPIKEHNPLFKELSGRAVVKSFPLLKDIQLRQWIQKHVKEANADITSQAVDSLVKLVGSNLWAMKNEIEKLVLFAGERRIADSDVKMLVSQTEQADVFAMVDAILEFKTDVASQRLQSLLKRGAAPTYLLFMLSRQIRLIVRAKELKKQGASESEIQSRLGIPSGFVIRKTIEQSTRYSTARLREIYRRLLISDLEIKTGKFDGELAVAFLISDIGGDTLPRTTR